MLLTLAAILIDRLWLRRTPHQKAAAHVAMEQEIAANQSEIMRLARDQGPQLVKALAALMDGSIGGKVGLGFQTPSRPGHRY